MLLDQAGRLGDRALGEFLGCLGVLAPGSGWADEGDRAVA
jgi:hypothetical protein